MEEKIDYVKYRVEYNIEYISKKEDILSVSYFTESKEIIFYIQKKHDVSTDLLEQIQDFLDKKHNTYIYVEPKEDDEYIKSVDIIDIYKISDGEE